MPLLREREDFEAALRRAAQRLGDLDPSFVEKDYWVTQVLRALQVTFPGGFTFKGGTSLSKGYRIIERFSEDVDILVVPVAGSSARDADDHLRAITAAVSEFLKLTWREGRVPGRGHDGSRGDLIVYAPRIDPGLRIGLGAGSVLLETGYGGGHEPAEMVTIAPILCEPLGIAPNDYDDTRAFATRALEPLRTLIEKLFAVHHLASLFETGDVRDEERFGRHYYDTYKLLHHRPTVTALTERRKDFAHLCAEVERISRIRYGGATAPPDGGFAASPAFTGERGELRRWLEQKYEEMRPLLPRPVRGPSFGDVIQRVHVLRALL